MSYLVFARKYRPQTFDDIIGQSHITNTLKNAISQGRVAHAYLFAGPRGVGKTTTARILAKALNCEKGPTVKPCNKCASCEEIARSVSLDILEIDGASNRGIEEIRNLRESVKFSPSKGKHRIYIIDEVHMLTPEAFNALLKTLEEPPPHAKFIFATTQSYKVPPTILSRCQRFDFRRISAKDIFENLKMIVKEEKLNVSAEALNLVARHSDGSMRDAQVILDQIASFAQDSEKVSEIDVARILGVVEDDILFGMSKSISEKDAASALAIIERLVNEGKDVTQITLGLIEHFRNISVVKIGSDPASLIDAGAEKIKRYKDEAQKFTTEELLYIIYTFSNTIDFIRKSNLPRIPLETAMIKLIKRESVISLAELMKKIDKLEKPGRTHEAEPDVPSQQAKPFQQVQSAHQPETLRKAETIKAPSGPSELDEILASWTGVINYIKARKMSIASYLQEGYPVNVDSRTLYIGFSKELKFHKETLESPENRQLIEEAIRDVLKLSLNVAITFAEPVKIERNVDNTPGADLTADGPTDETGAEKEVDPIVKSALEIFGGEIAAQKAERRKIR